MEGRRRIVFVSVLIVALCGGAFTAGWAGNFRRSGVASTSDLSAAPINGNQDIDDVAGADDQFDFNTMADLYGDKHYQHGDNSTLMLYNANSAYNEKGICLDGSIPAFWMRKAVNSESSDKWVVHLKGGGWCDSKARCADWVNSGYQSGTGTLPANTSGLGLLSVDPDVNPGFFDWNMVYVWYCDGGSYSGSVEEPVHHKGTKFYMRGEHVLHVIIETLLKDHGMDAATDVLLTGTSAGGLATIVNCDRVGEMVSSDATFGCVADAGFFFNSTDYSGDQGYWTNGWKSVVDTHGILNGNSLSTKCLNHFGDDAAWKCFLAENALKYVRREIFVIQSAMDLWQLEKNFFSVHQVEDAKAGLACLYNPLRACTFDTFAGIQDFREQILAVLHETVKDNDAVSLFVDSCFKHGQIERDKPYIVPKVHHATIPMTLHMWFGRLKTDNSENVREVDGQAWPHKDQQCDWGPEWEQWLNNTGLDLSTEDFVNQFVSRR